MALLEAFRAWKRGESWNNVFGYAYISQDEIDRGRTADSRLEEVNRQAFERGVWDEATYADVRARAEAGNMQSVIENPDSSPWSGFKEGAAEGAANMQGTIKSALAAPFNFTLGAIPWQVWLVVGVFVAWRFGLLQGLLKARR